MPSEDAPTPTDPQRSILEFLEEKAGVKARVTLKQTDSVPILKPIQGKTESGKYQLQGELARGGVGVVIKGHDTDLGRDVAIKTIREEYADRPEILARFVEEAQIGGQLQHPGIVPVYDIGVQGNRPFFTMKLIKGRTLAALLEEGRETRRKLLGIFEAVCQTMAYTHSRGVIHRDLKPANVMVGAFGEVQVVDWGMGKVLKSGGVEDERRALKAQQTVVATIRSEPGSVGSQSLVGSVMGTPGYMPPEQAMGEIDSMDERSDVFSLGAILAEILTGQPPYPGTDPTIIQQAAQGQLEPCRERIAACDADEELKKIALACLVPAPAARPRNAGELAERVSSYLATLEERAHAARVEAAEERIRVAEAKRKQKLTLALAASVLLIVVGGGGGWWWVTEQDAAREARLAAQFQAAVLEAGRAGEPAEALSAARRARDLIDQSDAAMPAPAVADLERIEADAMATQERARVERENRDLLAMLERVRGPGVEDERFSVDWETMDAGYAAAFRKLGLEPDAGSVDEAVAALRTRGDDEALAAALDDWTAIRREMKALDGAKRLANLASRLDQDRMRGTLRAALLSDDVATLTRLSVEVEVTRQDPRTLLMLARSLRYLGRSWESHQLFLRAHDAYPNNFMLAHETARSMFWVSQQGTADMMVAALRYYLVARALRPDNYIANVELGQQYINAEEYGRAEKLFRDMIAKRPTDAILAGELALVFQNSGRTEEAAAQFEAALRLDPNAVWVRRCRANFLVAQGRLDEAIREFEEVIRQNPKVAYAHSGLAWAHARMGDPSKLVPGLRRAVELDPANASHRLALTDALLRTGQPEEAVKECAAAAAAFPRSMRIRLGAARICGQLGRHAEALDYARQGLALAAELPKPPTVLVSDLHIAEGASLGGLGKVDEGIEAYRKAVAATPDRFAAHFTLASFSSNHRKLETARESFERALEIRPGNLEATTGLGFVHQQAGRPDEALECFERALEANPTHAPALSGIAEVHMAKGRTEEALESARALVTVAPNAGFAYYTLARALTGVGQYDEALRVVRRAAPMVPAWQIQFFVGDVSVRQGKYGDAAQAYRSALREQPTNLEVYGKLIDALHADGEQEKALEVARAAVKAVPGQGVSHFMEGLSLSVLRRYDEARAAYERALKLDFDNAFVRGAMADLLAATGKHEEALERLREIAKKKPDADAYYTLAWALATYPGAAERKPREALALARNANEMKPGSHRTLAAALYRAGRHAEAEAAFAQALDDGTDQHACGAYLRAMNLQKLGREEDARKWFEEAERRMAGEGKFPLPDHRWLRKEAVQVLGEGKKR